MAAEGMSLRDSFVRKTPARFADSEITVDKGPSAPAKSDKASSTVSANSSTATTQKFNPRSASPVTPGPPKGYQVPRSSPPSQIPPAEPQSAAVTPADSTAATPAAPTAANTTSALPVLPPSKVPVTTVTASNDEADLQLPQSIDPDEEDASPDENATPPSAQRPKARIYVPAKRHPDPDPSSTGTSSAAAGSRRFQPDRDDDFFLRRRVIVDLEKNPPTLPQLEDSDSGSEDTYAPRKQTTRKPVDDSEEESIVDLTNSSPRTVSPTKTPLPSPTKATTSKSTTSTKATFKKTASSKAQTSKASSSKARAPALFSTSATKKSKGKAKAVSSPEKTKGKSKQAEKSTSGAREKEGFEERADDEVQLAEITSTLTPEQALKRAKAAWTKAHSEANARLTAESAGLAYNPPPNPASQFYLHYKEPHLKQHSEASRDEVGIAFDCRCCLETPYTAWRTLQDSSTSLLRSHVGTKKAKGNLSTVLKSSGSGQSSGQIGIERYLVRKEDPIAAAAAKEPVLTAMQARQLAVGWVTEEARPLAILSDK